MSRTDGNSVHQDSPRPPAFTRQSSSRPAIRIRRLQARHDGSLSRGPLASVPEGTSLSPIPPSPLSQSHTPKPAQTPKSAFAKVKSKLSHSSGQSGDADIERGAQIEDALRPGEVAAIVRDARGQPTLAAVPEDILPSPPTGAHTRDRSRPDPHNSIPLPADPPSRDQPVICTETEETGKKSRKWWPFGKHKDDKQDVERASPPVARDYGAADGPEPIHNGQYAEDIVDWLDVIDPEVATVSTLSNVQNSLFLPDLGNLYNRMPIIDLSRRKKSKQRPKSKRRSTAQKMRISSIPHVSAFAEADEIEASERARIAQQALTREQEAAGAAAAAGSSQNVSIGAGAPVTTSPSPLSPHRDAATLSPPQWIETESLAESSPDLSRNPHDASSWPTPRRRGTSSTLSRSPSHDSQDSHDSDSSNSSAESSTPDEQEMRRRERLMRSVSTIRGEYAVLPAGIAWDEWTEEEKAELDDHVRHLMHSKREKFRRRMRGFRRFVSRPLGFLITLYAFLITFWGAAWVLFLIGWIYLGDRKGYFVEIADQILTALFCVVGIGLAPFRAVDTYHMIYIAHYHHLTWRLRRERNLPKLNDRNDLPAPSALDPDLEAQFQKPQEAPVLTPEQQAKLTHHQEKYHKSHTFYRPHETPTHKAFPLSLLIAITVLLDCHSMLQMSLGGTTWGIYYKNRPSALTATILSCSISCNLTAGFLISLGGRWSRKNEEVEKRVRQALTAEAMRNLEKQKREEEALKRGEPVGLQASIGRRVEKVQEKVKVQPREAEGDDEEKRGLTREESKDRREKGKEVPEHLTVPQMP